MDSKVIWRRRVILMLIVGLVVAVPITVLIRGGDGDEPATVGAAPTQMPTPETGPDERDKGLGVSYRVPKGWDESKEASAIRLSAPDKTAQVVIAAPAPAEDADVLLRETLAAFKTQYKKVKVAPGSGREVGGVKAKGAVITARRKGRELRVLVAVAPAKKKAYLVEVFTTANVSPSSLREAQVALNSLEFEK